MSTEKEIQVKYWKRFNEDITQKYTFTLLDFDRLELMKAAIDRGSPVTKDEVEAAISARRKKNNGQRLLY